MTTAKVHSRKLSFLVAILILLAGVFLGGYLVLKSGQVSAGQLDDILKGGPFDLKSCAPDPGDSNKDSDNDGLKDWQEIQIYRTDPCNPDTDDDGYLDGEEAASGYDPTIKGPLDALPGTDTKIPRPLPTNLTKYLSQLLTQQISQGKIDSFNLQGQVLSAGELAKYPALQQSIDQISAAGNQLFAPDKIDEAQIKTTNDISRDAVQKYAGETTSAIYPEGSPNPDGPTEPELFLQTMQSGDYSQLDAGLADYRQIYERLQNLTVPKNLIAFHKEELNIFSSLIKVYQGVRTFNDDPLKSFLAIQTYQATMQQMIGWMTRLDQFMAANYGK